MVTDTMPLFFNAVLYGSKQKDSAESKVAKHLIYIIIRLFSKVYTISMLPLSGKIYNKYIRKSPRCMEHD